MSEQKKEPSGPDLTAGVSAASLRQEGQILGHVGKDDVLVVQVGDDILAVGARCTHYRGPLAEGLVVGDTVRCPWHHACFSLRTGEHLRAPALDPIACWRVEQTGDRIVVKEKVPPSTRRASTSAPASIVIVGGGAAGIAAVDTLRREGFAGPLTVVSADEDAPYDRPNLSKDYLAGSAPEDWMPLRDADYYAEQSVRLLLKTKVTSIDTSRRTVALDNGTSLSYGALLLATGGTPVKLDVPGAESPRVHYLRSFADSRKIIGTLSPDTRAAVVGASFIGLEVAASLRARNLETHVIAPEERPLAKVMGPEIGDHLRRLHESKGVVFHLGEKVSAIDDGRVTLESGGTVDADIVIVGIGVTPVTDFLGASGIALDRGVAVNEYLETSVPGVYAAGDIARWPDPHTGERIRVEHWVVAERQGQVAARNMLGRGERFDAVPFFWSAHYDTTINYVGHAAGSDEIEVAGDLAGNDCAATFRRGGRTLAVATIGRDRESLIAEVELEKRSQGAGV